MYTRVHTALNIIIIVLKGAERQKFKFSNPKYDILIGSIVIEELGDKLENYLKRFGKKVKLVRKKERQGLIKARVEGARAATGEVVIFLDSHCEANVGW